MRLKRDKLASRSVVISEKAGKRKKWWKKRRDKINWDWCGSQKRLNGLYFPDLSLSLSLLLSKPVLLLLRAESQHLRLSDKGGVTATFNLWPWGHRLSVVLTRGSESHRSAVSPPRHEPCQVNFDTWPQQCCNDGDNNRGDGVPECSADTI